MNFFCVLLVAVLMLAGCATGVSQEEYDKVVSERNALKEQTDIAESSDPEEEPESTEVVKCGELVFEHNKSNRVKTSDNGALYIYFGTNCFVMMSSPKDMGVSSMTLDDAKELKNGIDTNLTKQFETVNHTDIQKTVIAGQDAYWIEYTLESGKGNPYHGNYKQVFNYFILNGNLYAIAYISPADIYEQHHPEYKQIIDSGRALSQVEAPAAPAAATSLGVTDEMFAVKVNNNLETIGSNVRIGRPQREGDSQFYTAVARDNENIAFNLTVDSESKKLTQIIMIGTGDGTEQSGLDIFVTAVATIMVVDDTMSRDQAGNLFMDLFEQTKIKQNASTVANNISYTIASSEALGTWLTISPSNIDELLKSARIDENNFTEKVESALEFALEKGELITGVNINENRELTIGVNILDGEPSLLSLEKIAVERAKSITEDVLGRESFDEYWDTIVIDFVDVGVIKLKKSDIISTEDGRHFKITSKSIS